VTGPTQRSLGVTEFLGVQPGPRGMPKMDTERAIDSAEILLRRWAVRVDDVAPWRLDVLLPLEDLRPAAQILCGTEWGQLTSITVLQLAERERQLELIYDFRQDQALVCLKVRLQSLTQSVPSLSKICPCAQPFEDSFRAQYGITFA
jgi:NADH:ubiquinone oxidoreductase subunit C